MIPPIFDICTLDLRSLLIRNHFANIAYKTIIDPRPRPEVPDWKSGKSDSLYLLMVSVSVYKKILNTISRPITEVKQH